MSEIGTSPKKGIPTALGMWMGDPNDPLLWFMEYTMKLFNEPGARQAQRERHEQELRLIAQRIHPKTCRLLDALKPDECHLPNSYREMAHLAILPPRVQAEVVAYITQHVRAEADYEERTGYQLYDDETSWRLSTVEGALDDLRWTPGRIATIRTSSSKLRKPQKRTLEFHRAILAVTARYEQMTVRQLFYQLVAHGLEKSEKQYKRVSDAAVQLRLSGQLPYRKIVDSSRTRRPVYQHGSMSEALSNAADIYRRNYWLEQPANVEIWCEKDALTGIIHPICQQYGVTHLAIRGFSSASLYYESATDLRRIKRPTNIYYFGDHDPSGYAISDNLEDELLEHGADVTVKRVGLLPHHLSEYNLPTHPAKESDSRYQGFVRKYGKAVIELDALPPDALEAMIRASIEENIDWESWNKAMEGDGSRAP